MTVNISSQTIALTIGAQNWSAWIESIQIGYGEYEMGSGLMPCTGTINLIFPANYAGIPSNPEYRFNAQQWRRGQLVQILVSGAALPCSGLALKILKPPQRPNKGINGIAKMAISVGCTLAYQYFPPEPNADFSGITAGTPKTRGEIINSILGTLGITASVAIAEYPIDYPLPKIEGNWLDMCGQLADSAGYYLRCDTAGTVVAERILNNGASGITYTIGTDESDWTAIGDVGETPVEKLVLTGVARILKEVDTSNPTVLIEEQPIGTLLPDLGFGQSTSIALTISKRTTTSKKRSNLIETALEIIEEPIGVILPDLGFNQSTSIALTISKKITNQTFFSDGFIRKIVETIQQPIGVIFPDLGFNQSTSIALTISKQTTREWQKKGDQIYQEIFTELQPIGVIFPDLGFNQSRSIALTISKETTTEGKSAPPTDQPLSDFTSTESQITSEVYAAQIAPSEGRERQRTIAVPYADNVAQLSEYGQIFNKLISGRSLGWQFATRLNTTLLPMQTVRIIDGTTGYILRTDAMQWAMTQTEAYLVFNGIEDGVFNAATPNDISYPVSFPLSPITARLVNDNYSIRSIITITARLENENSGITTGLVTFARLQNTNYGIEQLFVIARLVNSNYGQVPTESEINAKMIAYWNMNAFIGTAPKYIQNAINPATFELTATTVALESGLISNALYSTIGDTETQLYADTVFNLTAINPRLNAFDFVGFAFWIKLRSVNTGALATGTTYGFNNLLYTEKYGLSYRISTSDPVEVSTLELEFRLSVGGSVSGSAITGIASPTGWNLITFEITRSGLSIKLNNGTAVTSTYTENTIALNSLQFYFNDGSLFAFAIDEMFIYNSPMSNANFNEIYNAGLGKTYPY